MVDATAIAASLEQAWGAFLERERRPAQAHPYVYASAYRRCERRMVLEMTAPEALPPYSLELLAKFRRATDRERDLLADLARVGREADPPMSIEGQQRRFELRDRKGRVAIVGKVDAQVRVGSVAAPLEVKTYDRTLSDRITRFADLLDSPWMRAGAYQTLAYLYGAAVPFGFLLIDRAGRPLLLPVELDPYLDQMEEFLTRAERALDHVAAGTLPPYLVGDAAECKRCPFYGGTCNPPLAAGAAVVLTDPELEAALARREALAAAADEYEALDRQVKGRLRGIEHGVIGPYILEGKWGAQSTIKGLPEALRQQYTETNPKGRFTLTITRV